jgi:DNA-binding transcriptional LysR family regulator
LAKLRNSSLNDLQNFLMAASYRSFSAAAKQKGVTAGALSKSVRNLEVDLGAPLFDRTPRGICLSPVGNEFLPTATRLLGDFDVAMRDVRSLTRGERGHLSILVERFAAEHLVTPMIAGFIARYPAVTIQLHPAHSDSVMQGVMSGTADIGIATGRPKVWPDLRFNRLLRDQIVAIMHRDHPLASFDNLTWDQLVSYPCVSWTSDSGLPALIQTSPAATKILGNAKHEISTAELLFPLLEESGCFSLIPSLAMSISALKDFQTREIQPELEATTYLVTRRERQLSAVAQNFLYCLEASRRTAKVSTPNRKGTNAFAKDLSAR